MASSSSESPDKLPETKAINESLTTIETFRAARLADMVDIRSARDAAFTRQRDALAAVRGETDPEVQALDLRIAENRSALEFLSAESARAQIPAPIVGAEEWVLYGFVSDGQGARLGGLTVALSSGRKRIEGGESSTTDAQGQYLLRVPLGGKGAHGLTAEAAGKKATASATTSEVTVSLLDAKDKSIYAYPDPVSVQPGTASYLEMAVTVAQRGRPSAR